MSTTTPTAATTAAPAGRWRTVDIVVAAVVAVAFGVIFWAWNLLWNGPASAIPLPGRALMYGVWLLPAVLGALIVRRPGAALFTETVAALVSVALGTEWGWTIALQGPVEALAAEVAFAVLLYRNFRAPAAMLAGGLAGSAAALWDVFVWYPGYSWPAFRLPYLALVVLSSVLIAGLGSVALVRALAGTGVLDRFPAGRSRAEI